MNFNMYASSSKGNLYVLETKEEALLIEAGLSISKTKKYLDYDFSKIKGCLISHEHGDHAKSVKDIGKLGIDVYASEGTFKALELEGHRFVPVKGKQQFTVSNFKVLAFNTQHDAEEPLGYLIQANDKKFLFATDTYYIRYKFKELNYIALECNYSEEILERNITDGIIPASLAERVKRSHFSLENVIEFLKANDLSKLKVLYLLHLSDSNSDVNYFREKISEIYNGNVVIAE
jgi:phosphoribosyl 1,2-cyclic phosphodiesterase